MEIKNVSNEDLSGIDTFVNGSEHPIAAGETIELPDNLAGILIRRLDPKVILASLDKSRDSVNEVEKKVEVKKVEVKKAGRPKKSK